jgi:hypothetical protein
MPLVYADMWPHLPPQRQRDATERQRRSRPLMLVAALGPG